MSQQPTSQEDRSAALIPPLALMAPWRLVSVEAVEALRLKVRFKDGLEGLVDLSGLIASPKAGLFAELSDPVLFRAVRLDLGVATWPNGADLAPDAMHRAIAKQGIWVL
jgi:Protein of unknown function (DUF2442)